MAEDPTEMKALNSSVVATPKEKPGRKVADEKMAAEKEDARVALAGDH